MNKLETVKERQQHLQPTMVAVAVPHDCQPVAESDNLVVEYPISLSLSESMFFIACLVRR